MASGPLVFGSQTSLREANRARIVETIKSFGGLTQVELADATGLSSATVSIIVKELVHAGIVATRSTSRNGRRAIHVTLARRLGLVAGIHFSRRYLRVALADLSGEIVAEHGLPLSSDHRADTGLDRAALLITDMMTSIEAEREELLQVCLGLSAPLSSATGAIYTPGILRGWDGLDIAAALEQRLHVPVLIDNDANLGALAECRAGAGRESRMVVYLNVNEGIGAGLYLNGDIVRGATGAAGEIGHMSSDENGPICYCGNRGCLEMVAGSRAMLESLRPTHGDLRLSDLVAKAHEGDPGCRRVIGDSARRIGIALAQVCNILDPERVVVGGAIAATGDLFLDPLRVVTARHTLPGEGPSIDIVAGCLGERAEVTGAIFAALGAVTVPAGTLPLARSA
ncbi:MAG: ROK family transcriptional regulator [Propionibacteriaceae bacterium]|jgi:predicted NBD/HSP70 family sugar kinase|nr:ROK family transcriptional regulator [Propionibacteriaceae bacterium]